MKHLFSILFVVLFATSMLAQTGLTCEDPIPVDKSYVGTVNAGDELWYTASTWDLPMHVYFSPDIPDTKRSPEVMIDFTCDPGVYTDHKLDSVLRILEAMNVYMPVEFLCDKVVRDGKVEWDLSIDERYRDQLTEFGLTHNIQAFVKVYFPDGGEIRLTPDQQFQNCMENGRYVKLGDTIDIAANDSNTMLVLPFSEWKNDSIRLVWIGDKDARVWVAEEECQFTPTDASIYIKAKYDLDQNTVKKLYPEDMQLAIDNWIGKGIFYGKVLSAAPGKLVVERIPLGEIQGGATLLKHGESVRLQANDSRVFCFPKGWNATEFLANTQYLMAMHVSNTPDFQPGDANVLTVYPFTKEDGKRKLQLTSGDISNLGASAMDDYLYVRFTCNTATTLTPQKWNVSSCVDNTIYIPVGEIVTIPASSKSVYRICYDAFAGYDLTLTWGQKNVNLSAYVASYCDFVTTATDKLKTISVRKNSSTTVKASEVDSWSSSVENERFLYVRFSSSRQGDVTFTSSKPTEEDPLLPDPVYTTINDTLCFGETYDFGGTTYAEGGTYEKTFTAANGADSIVTLNLLVLHEVKPVVTDVTIDYGQTYEWNGKTYTQSASDTITLQDAMGCDYLAILKLTVMDKPVSPCVLGSIELKAGDQLTLNLDSAFTIYRVNYAEFAAQDRTLTWTGATDLHTFVAETCTFAVAPYNRYVHVYVPVPAKGETLWTAAQWADLAAFVDEDGYLYLRFLTEKEGVLTVE